MKTKLLKKIRARFIFVKLNDGTSDVEMLDIETDTIYERFARNWRKYPTTVIKEASLLDRAISIVLDKPIFYASGKRWGKKQKRLKQRRINEIKNSKPS